jgi:protease-4
VREFADGRLIIGHEAKQIGLVDDFGDIYDAAREALRLAGVTLATDELPNLHYANRKKNVLDKLLDASSSVTSAVSAFSTYPKIEYRAF